MNNNKLTNNINIINNEDKTENTKSENETHVEYGEYICFKENQIDSWSFWEALYGKHKNKNFEIIVKIIETSTKKIRREIN